MIDVVHLNLIHVFGFYLLLIFLIGLFVRFRQYHAVVMLVRAMPGRWPKLFQLLKQHYGLFLDWQTLLPGIIALTLVLLHTFASRLVWPQSRLTPGMLTEVWLAVPIILAVSAGMVGLDVYLLRRVGKIDRAMLEKHFDQAEYWLRSWAAPVVKIVTFGWVNPHKRVNDEVQKALLGVKSLLHASLWWVSVQTSLRIAVGLSLWLTYFWTHSS